MWLLLDKRVQGEEPHWTSVLHLHKGNNQEKQCQKAESDELDVKLHADAVYRADNLKGKGCPEKDWGLCDSFSRPKDLRKQEVFLIFFVCLKVSLFLVFHDSQTNSILQQYCQASGQLQLQKCFSCLTADEADEYWCIRVRDTEDSSDG